MVEVVKRRRIGKGDDLPEILESTREYYRAFSEKYEKFYEDWLSGEGSFSDPEYKMGYDRVLTTLAGLVDEGQLIVDVGCGVGTWAILMAGLGAHVIGLDQSVEALTIHKERSKIANVSEKISEIIGDGHYCPFRNDVFDGLTLNWVLAHIHPKENRKFMKEVGRALRGNAWTMVSDSYWRGQDGGKEQSQVRRTDKGNFEVYKYYYTPEELRDLLEDTFGRVADIETTRYEMLCVAKKSE